MNFKCYKYKENWNIISKMQSKDQENLKRKKQNNRHTIFKVTTIIKHCFSTETMKTKEPKLRGKIHLKSHFE